MLIRTLVRKNFEIVDAYAGTATVKKSITRQRAFVVMDENVHIGVLTAEDLIEKPHNLIVDCLIEKPYASSFNSIYEVLDLMKKSNIRILPVFDEGCFSGLIYHEDILEQLSKIIEEQRSILQIVAHDLKSPIASILGLVSLLKDNEVVEDNNELVALTETACHYANEIISDLLLIPQLDGEQRQDEIPDLAEINAFLRECIAGIQVIADAKQTDVVFETMVEKKYLPIHRVKLKRAIHNLLTNAIKFSPVGGKVTVSVGLTESNCIQVRIKDTGIGIPLSNQSFIFNKFTKAKRAGTQGEKSTGLGLFITKQIIEMHEAELLFESSEQVGTTFFINFKNNRQSALQ